MALRILRFSKEVFNALSALIVSISSKISSALSGVSASCAFLCKASILFSTASNRYPLNAV